MKAESHLAVVIDTNVWISAMLTKTGAPALLVRRVLAHGRPVFSPATFGELETRLWLPKFDRYVTLERRQQLLHDAAETALWVDIPADIAAQTHSRDPNDDKFIHVALALPTPWLVTGDQDLLVLRDSAALPHLNILTPVEALGLREFSETGGPALP